MKTKSFKKCKIVFAVLLCASHAFAEATLASGVDQNRPAIYCVSNHVEVLVRTLQLLTESTEWIQKRLEREDARLKYARPSAQQWHKRVLSSAIQPPPDAKTVFLEAKAGQADTIETRWNSDNYFLTSVQTASLLFIIVSPRTGGTGRTLNEKHGNAKELSLRLFAESTVRRTGQGDGRVISNLAARITDGLFSSTTQLIIRDKEYACGGFSVLNDTKTKASTSNEKFSLKEIDQSNDENLWMASTFRAHYWFGNIVWWNNGATIVFYILKTDGRPPELYDHSFDEGWFSPSTRFRFKKGTIAQSADTEGGDSTGLTANPSMAAGITGDAPIKAIADAVSAFASPQDALGATLSAMAQKYGWASATNALVSAAESCSDGSCSAK